MKTILVLFLVSLSVASREPKKKSEFLRVKEYFQILSRNSRSLFSDQGILNGVRLCGGEGTFLQWRHESCNSTSRICVIQAEKYYRSEMAFIPSTSSSDLELHASIRDAHGNSTVYFQYDSPGLLESTVEAGKKYALTMKAKYSSQLHGKLLNLRITLIRPTDKVVEVCTYVDYYIE